jgi:quercetin dioxygenase-like cupin family protein
LGHQPKEQAMDQQAFARQLREEGFDEVTTRSMPAGKQVGLHTHPFEVKALVTEGDITVGVAGQLTTYYAGEVFTMPPNCEHTELYGENGVTYLIGRKHR